MDLWYRHSGQDTVDGFPKFSYRILKTFHEDQEILADLDGHDITHLYVYKTRAPSLNLIAPKLSALKLVETPREGLDSLIKNLEFLTEIKELHFEGIKLSHKLVTKISQLTSLEKLFLCSCELDGFPESLNSLTELKELSIEMTKLSDKSVATILQLTSLEKLSLDRCHLTHLPETVPSLNNLKELDLKHNDFSRQFPQWILLLTKLETLNLSWCQLTQLPAGFSKLENLKKLVLNRNNFVTLPPEICDMKTLEKLFLRENPPLQSLNIGLQHMPCLEKLDVEKCQQLKSPPLNVCRQGPKAIKQYYKDLLGGEGSSLPAATVSVIGKSKAGKTSVIRTLQQNARVLTGSVGAEVDVSTKVFNFEEVEVEKAKLRFIDFGGQEIYHLAYGLTLRANCVPVIVVNMEMYKQSSDDIGGREAVRRFYFDWMAHLYLAQPDLPAPRLVITHKDKFTSDEFEKIKAEFLSCSTSVRDSIRSEERQHKRNNLDKIKHLSATDELFQESNIFEVGSGDDKKIFESLKQQLLDHCESYVMKVPKVWEEVEESMKAYPKAFVLFEDLLSQLAQTHQIQKEQLEIILTYMHYSGKLLWYKDVEGLQNYVFHKIAAVTALLNVLLDHSSDTRWDTRAENFAGLTFQSQDFQREKYLQSVESFKATGIVSSLLLTYLIHSETDFKTEVELVVALKLLTTFRLAFGEVKSRGEPAYIVPHFAVGYSSSTPATTEVQLHVDLVFYGLPLPQYVYHEMTVELLKLFPSEMDAPSVRHNGASVEADESIVSLTHDSKSKKASISICCSTKEVGESWKQLIKVTNNVIKHVRTSWQAVIIECVQYCAHCKLIDSKHPVKETNPSWSDLSAHAPETELRPTRQVKCRDNYILAALKHPCHQLSDADKQKLIDYVNDIKRSAAPKKVQQTSEEDSDSGAKDYAKYSLDQVATILDTCAVSSTQDENIKVLFNNTDLVYKMTSPRGVALVINNRDFKEAKAVRLGSEVDVQHVEKLLNALDFDVQLQTNLTSRKMLEAVDQAAKNAEEQEDYGMFVLVLMSHGKENDQIYGTDGTVIELSDVFYLLSCENFPAMAGKPKLVIVQACRGDLKDFGDKGRSLQKPPEEQQVRSPPIIVHRTSRHSGGLSILPTDKIEHLDRDDLIVIHPTFADYVAVKHESHGSPFISCLVHHFYKYACSMDVKEICYKIQEDVRAQSLQFVKEDPERCSGQIPPVTCTLTNGRKLYLFPGYNSP